ncbi:hypothetical protein A0H81_08836 [Grifola frondosa]|uniref:Uncharacterized protein n=1 Tax=Grifola frondosa TaxID=5627 RepID=A0A1C7M476_GRIFR|nr:hypothetical protein A0H81_08836 [Grifola frondosa]
MPCLTVSSISSSLLSRTGLLFRQLSSMPIGPLLRPLFQLTRRLRSTYNCKLLYSRIALDEQFLDRVMGELESVGRVNESTGQFGGDGRCYAMRASSRLSISVSLDRTICYRR